MTFPLVSVTCVSNRPTFMPAVMELFRYQAWPNREFILVDGSPDGKCIKAALADPSWPPIGTRMIYEQVPPVTCVGAMRNLGMKLATGEFMAWMDDDGWHDPLRIQHLTGLLLGDEEFHAIGVQGIYWTDLRGDFYHYRGTPGFPISGSMVWRRVCAERHSFNETKRRASDHGWISAVKNDPELRMRSVDEPTWCVGVSHGMNLSNPKPPNLARNVSNVDFSNFYPDKEYGLKAHMARIKKAVHNAGGLA